MALLRQLTILFAAALLVVVGQTPSSAAPQEGQVYLLRVHLYEGFTQPMRGVLASFHYGAGEPSFGDEAERAHLREAFGIREALPLASVRFVLRSGSAGRRAVAYAADGRASSMEIEVLPMRQDGNIFLDLRLLHDGAEVFHSGAQDAPGKMLAVGAEYKATGATGRKFFLAVTASETNEMPDAAPLLLKKMRASPPPSWPAAVATGDASLLLDARGSAPRVLAGDAPPELLKEALRAAATWGPAVGFVHFRTGK